MTEMVGVSLRSVQRIWAAHDLQPHRIRTFKSSHDPEFAAKLADIGALYMDPPKHAIGKRCFKGTCPRATRSARVTVLRRGSFDVSV